MNQHEDIENLFQICAHDLSNIFTGIECACAYASRNPDPERLSDIQRLAEAGKRLLYRASVIARNRSFSQPLRTHQLRAIIDMARSHSRARESVIDLPPTRRIAADLSLLALAMDEMYDLAPCPRPSLTLYIDRETHLKIETNWDLDEQKTFYRYGHQSPFSIKVLETIAAIHGGYFEIAEENQTKFSLGIPLV